MTETQKQRLEEIIEHGYEFHFGEYISRGFNIIGKSTGAFIGYTLVFFMIIMFTSMIPVVGSLAMVVLSPALSVGFYIYAHRLENDMHPEFGDFFKGFDHVGQLVLTYIVMSIILLLSAAPMLIAVSSSGFLQWYWELIMDPQNADVLNFPDFPFWSLILLLPMIYLSVAYKWAYPFVVFYNLSFWDAMEYSRRIVSKNWFMIFLFAIVAGIIGGLGVILFLIGVLYTVPAMICADYAAFADVTGLNLEEEGDISEHLVD